jgi:hypothetical protein
VFGSPLPASSEITATMLTPSPSLASAKGSKKSLDPYVT